MPLIPSPKTQSSQTSRRDCSLLLTGFIIALLAAPAWAAQFEIQRAVARVDEGVYRLNANIDYQLSVPVRDALNNGVALAFEMQVDILQEREVLWNTVLASLNQRSRLEYHELSRQYILENLNTGIVETFSTLSSALRSLGEVEAFPILDASLLDPQESYSGQLRVWLELDELPLPIRARAYLSSAWRLDSDWYPWPLR